MMKKEIIVEGKTKLKVYLGKISKKLPVFYNPAKEFDRDLSILFSKVTKIKTCLDLLAGTGARGIRLLNEAKLDYVHFNDVNKEATKLIKENLRLNQITKEHYNITNEEANKLCSNLKDKFDFVDIDPFGSPINFVANAIPRISKNGYLAVTATDTAPLHGVYPKKCFKKYGAKPLRVVFGHEIGLRILAKAVIELGTKQDIGLRPIFAHVTKHYYRIYFIKEKIGDLIDNIGFIYFCPKCKYRFFTKFETKEKCPKCKSILDFAGPLYVNKLCDEKILNKMSKFKKHNEFLNKVIKESKVNLPYFYNLGEFKFKQMPKMEDIEKKLKNLGYSFARSHILGTGFKTNADFRTISKLYK